MNISSVLESSLMSLRKFCFDRVSPNFWQLMMFKEHSSGVEISWQTFRDTEIGALGSLTRNSFLNGHFLTEVKCLPSISSLGCFLSIMDCQKWGETPYQYISSWETNRISLLKANSNALYVFYKFYFEALNRTLSFITPKMQVRECDPPKVATRDYC